MSEKLGRNRDVARRAVRLIVRGGGARRHSPFPQGLRRRCALVLSAQTEGHCHDTDYTKKSHFIHKLA